MPFITSSPPHTSDRPVEFPDGLSAFGLLEPGLRRTNTDQQPKNHQEHRANPLKQSPTGCERQPASFSILSSSIMS
jgi:hypothetical protein